MGYSLTKCFNTSMIATGLGSLSTSSFRLLKFDRALLVFVLSASSFSLYATTSVRSSFAKKDSPAASPEKNKDQKKASTSNKQTYIRSVTDFRSKLSIPLVSNLLTVTIADDEFEQRLKASKTPNDTHTTIEPLQVSVGPTDEDVLKLANTLAAADSRFSLAQLLKERFKTSEPIPDSKHRLVTIDKQALSMINRRALDELYSKTHFELTVQGKQLNQNRREKLEFMRQIRPYLTPKDLNQVAQHLKKGSSIPVEKYLLPDFAKQNIRRFSSHRGPNCFHAALSFQSVAMSQTSRVNVRREIGYHRDMINYDELWRVIQLEFYEVSLDKTDLQYGDMVLFFDTAGTPETWVNFKSLRHAATYLFNGFVFSKGSKSANSPYTIRPISDEWAIWTKFSKEIGAKVFRKKSISDKKSALWIQDEWMD